MQWKADSCVGAFQVEMLQPFALSPVEVPHFAFDADYLNAQAACHGGIPQQQFFKAQDRRIYRVGRFINALQPVELSKPLRSSFMDSTVDERVYWSRWHLRELETFQQGLGAYLLPFAFLYNETVPPDDMDPMFMDCLCFDYRQVGTPRVLLWFNDPAVGEFYRCEELGTDPRTNLDYSRCTMPVADSFLAFTELLAESESDLA